ncbi:protein LBH [Denticeps clupeoides]|nr:protein LBH-like [Denticeps clupeoides]XP_028836653.1 protein LBH-like [Denticeps clupeoides]
MTDVINSPEPAREDFSGGGASGEQGISFQIFPDTRERYPKLAKRLPSIVVEPTEGEVESGELRWPPDDLRSTDTSHRQAQALSTSEQMAPGQSTDVAQDSSMEMSAAAGADSQ